MGLVSSSSTTTSRRLIASNSLGQLRHAVSLDPSSFTILDLSDIRLHTKEEHRELCDLLLSLPASSTSLKNLSAFTSAVDEDVAACYARLLLLSSPASLERLRFYDTNMTKKGFDLILHSLHTSSSSSSSSSRFPNLTHLSFEWDINMGRGGEEAFLTLGEMLSSSNTPPCLQSLTLRRVGMNAKAAHLLASSLNTSHLLYLDVSGNEDIGDEGVEYIAEMLRLNTSLDTLNLANTGFSGVGAQFLSMALTFNTSLTTLNISDNFRIGQEGMDCFQHPHIITSLKHLQFSCASRICPTFIDILQRTTTLTTLDLYGNEEKDPSRVEVLFKAIAQHKHLHSLDLRGCGAVQGEKVVACILNTLHLNSSLTKIDLGGTPLEREGKTAPIIQALQDNIKKKSM